jgi:hypothetical protein
MVVFIYVFIFPLVSPQASAETPEILSCYRSMRLWVSWDRGVIAAGYGRLYANQLVSWADPNPISVVVLTVLSQDEMTPAEWILPKSLRESLLCF